MLLPVVDANSEPQVGVVPGQEVVVDRSAATTGVVTPIVLMPANAQRSGWIMQNQTGADAYVSEIGDAAHDGVSFIVKDGVIFPPPDFPVTTGAISVAGVNAGKIAAREW